MEEARLYLRPESYYADQNVTLRLGEPVTAIDPASHRIETPSGSVPYDHLVLTTGSVPRRLPAAIGGALGGVYTVRTLADVDAMAPEFVADRRVLVVGGGYIGLEAAAGELHSLFRGFEPGLKRAEGAGRFLGDDFLGLLEVDRYRA